MYCVVKDVSEKIRSLQNGHPIARKKEVKYLIRFETHKVEVIQSRLVILFFPLLELTLGDDFSAVLYYKIVPV